MKSLYEVPVPGGRTSSPGNGIPGVDGDRDGRADIHNDADSIHSAANYLTKSGVSAGAAGVRRALFAYNPVDWYVNDVLHYATRYGGGSIPVDTNNCGGGTSDPKLPSLTSERVAIALAWAKNHDGDSYRMGPRGRTRGIARALPKPPSRKLASRCPHRHCATQLAGRRQRHPHPARPRKPGDLIFWDSYRGPSRIGHVMIIWNPANKTTIEARNTRGGVGHFSYADGPSHHIFEIWRVGNLGGRP
jgi:hypothetical protein